MKFESRLEVPQTPEGSHLSLEEIFKDRKAYNDLQREELMPLAYHLRHPEESEPADRNKMAMEWVTEGDAQKLEEYILAHPTEELDPHNPEEVKHFLEEVDPRLKEKSSETDSEDSPAPTLH